MSNLEIWDRFADIDPDMTKPITGKDYSGTSPNAHYITRCLTELFGPVGIGFGWRVVAENIEVFGDTSIHWCRIEFWHTDRANTFESYGQTKMAYNTKSGYMKVDEDAPKKSLTDAITKAAAQVGIAANIFLGRWDDNKYVAKVEAEYNKAKALPFDADGFCTKVIDSMKFKADMDSLNALWNHKDVKANLAKMDGLKQAEIESAYDARVAELL